MRIRKPILSLLRCGLHHYPSKPLLITIPERLQRSAREQSISQKHKSPELDFGIVFRDSESSVFCKNDLGPTESAKSVYHVSVSNPTLPYTFMMHCPSSHSHTARDQPQTYRLRPRSERQMDAAGQQGRTHSKMLNLRNPGNHGRHDKTHIGQSRQVPRPKSQPFSDFP